MLADKVSSEITPFDGFTLCGPRSYYITSDSPLVSLTDDTL